MVLSFIWKANAGGDTGVMLDIHVDADLDTDLDRGRQTRYLTFIQAQSGAAGDKR